MYPKFVLKQSNCFYTRTQANLELRCALQVTGFYVPINIFCEIQVTGNGCLNIWIFNNAWLLRKIELRPVPDDHKLDSLQT